MIVHKKISEIFLCAVYFILSFNSQWNSITILDDFNLMEFLMKTFFDTAKRSLHFHEIHAKFKNTKFFFSFRHFGRKISFLLINFSRNEHEKSLKKFFGLNSRL